MIGVRLSYRLAQDVKPHVWQSNVSKGSNDDIPTGSADAFLDDRPINQVIKNQNLDDSPIIPAEEDTGTALNIAAIPDDLRQSRNCTLCLEERTDSCITECGHLFCWNCIVGWGREKVSLVFCSSTRD
jgi:peroxin-10